MLKSKIVREKQYELFKRDNETIVPRCGACKSLDNLINLHKIYDLLKAKHILCAACLSGHFNV
jgi:hypothetical protein